jgi:hypothetical protein
MKLKIAFIFLVLASLACGSQATTPTPDVNPPSSDYNQPSVMAVSVEPTEAGPVWITTGALNVRSQANADSTILGTLAPFTEIQIFITYEKTDGCYGGEWYQIFYKPDGGETVKAFVCSLWVVRK